MNTIVIVLVLLVSWVISIVLMAKNEKHLREKEDYINNLSLLAKEKQELKNLAKDKTDLVLIKERQFILLSKVLIQILETAITKHKNNTLNNKFPFVFKANIERTVTPLNSIRFKKVNNENFIYVNGAMLPTDLDIIIDNYSTLDTEDYDFYVRCLKKFKTEEITEKELVNIVNQ